MLMNYGVSPINYTLSVGTNSITNTNGYFNNLAAGNYTITAVDANSCSISTVVNITNPTVLSWLTISTSGTTCGSGDISVSAIGGVQPYTFKINNSGYQNIGNFYGANAGYNIIECKDANGCSITTTVTVPGLFMNSSFTNVTCNNLSDGSLTVSATGNIQYQLNGGVTQASGIFTNLSANTYTITASDANGCSVTTTQTIVAPSGNHCCSTTQNPNSGSNIVAMQNMILLSNPTANVVVTQYAISNIISNKQFYIDGTFTIDHDITFDNCTLYFTPNANVVLSNGAVAFNVINGSTLQASCDWWEGIQAYDAGNKILIIGSTVKDMNIGIQLLDDAEIKALNSDFVNNSVRSIKYENITNSNYAGYVKGCTFELGISTNSIPQHGIEIVNSDYINIGENVIGDGNIFKDLYNGISIVGNASITGSSNQIGVYNNSFENIQNSSIYTTYGQILNDIYSSTVGSAVHIDYGTVPIFEAHTTVSNTSLPTSANIVDCMKGVISINNHLISQNLNMTNTNFGIMNYDLMKRNVTVNNNTISNADIGIQLAGNYSDYTVSDNIISLTQGVEVSNAGFGLQAFMYPAIGVDIKQTNQPYINSETQTVSGNTITIPYYAGKGIANLGTNESQKVMSNTINFTVNNLATVPSIPYIDPVLYGIFNSKCNDFTLSSNYVNGQYSNSLYQACFSRAYYFETSKQMSLLCNKAKATKQGFYAWGNCETANDKIKHNKFRYNLNPLFTLDNGAPQPGTFGNIGNGTVDNENDWLYNMSTNTTWLQSGIYKIWRFSNSPSTHNIYTSSSLLNALGNESGSNNTDQYKYSVQNPTGMTNTDNECPDLSFGNTLPPLVTLSTTGMGDIDEAEAIAGSTEVYINFVEVGGWMNHKWLFERLNVNEDLRNSSSILQNFYNDTKNGSIGIINNVDMAMSALFDFKGNEDDMINLYEEAMSNNQDIVGTVDYELNEQAMNAIALILLRYGKDSITTAQKMELEILANTCPFVGGSAVYKARTLNALYNPMAQYNDRLLCLQSVAKGGTSYVNIDSLYEAQTNESADALAAQQGYFANDNLPNELGKINKEFEEILIYPNPAKDYIIISNLEMNAKLKLMDATGRVVLEKQLDTQNGKQKINLPRMVNGLYTYKISNLLDSYTGKINIVQNE